MRFKAGKLLLPRSKYKLTLSSRSGDLENASRQNVQLQLIKTNKKQRGGHLFNERVIVHCLIMAQRQLLVNILFKEAPPMDGEARSKKKKTCRRRKEKKDEYLKLSTMPRTILFYKNYIKK